MKDLKHLKNCRICLTDKPLDLFPKQSRICKECKEIRRKASIVYKSRPLQARDGLTNIKDKPIEDWGCRYWLYKTTGYENNELTNRIMERYGLLKTSRVSD